MVFMPPRHGKSMTISETFPSYYIGKNPNRRVIMASYGDSLAKKFGRANKRKLEQYGDEVFQIGLSKDNSSVTNWDIEGHRGGMISAGIGGSITGEGADLLLIDDPIKNREEADSETYREKVWNEWQNTLLTRLHAGGSVIIILTRWHEDDLAGRLLREQEELKKIGDLDPEDEWTVLSLPAICEAEDDVMGREIGEALWPEHGYDQKWAKQKERDVGSRTWSALYQQRPAPTEGQLLQRHWWNFYKELPKMHEQIQSWDCTFKDTKGSDWVVGQLWGRVAQEYYLIAQIRRRLDLPGTIVGVKRMTVEYPLARAKYVEDKANGPAVIQMLKKHIFGLIAVNPEGGKVARVNAVSPMIESGNVYLPDPSIAPWVNAFIDECAAFPNGTHDDQVDCMSQALFQFSKRKKVGAIPKPKGW
jgi:predicted phage terminase large subunit-like protein